VLYKSEIWLIDLIKVTAWSCMPQRLEHFRKENITSITIRLEAFETGHKREKSRRVTKNLLKGREL